MSDNLKGRRKRYGKDAPLPDDFDAETQRIYNEMMDKYKSSAKAMRAGNAFVAATENISAGDLSKRVEIREKTRQRARRRKNEGSRR